MDTSNWRHIEDGSGDVGDSSMESSDWRAQLQADLRERMVNRILDAMKMHLQVSGDEGLQELRKVAVSFEEKIYATATSQSDYMRKTCFKILTIETRSQNPMPDANSVNNSDPASLDSTNGEDWQEEVYEKIKTMKDLYLQDLNDMHQKLHRKLQQHASLPQQSNNEQLEKLKVFKNMLERFMAFLQIQKHNILVSYKDKLSTYEKQIVHIITSNLRKPAATQQPPPQPLPPPPHMHSVQQNISMNGSLQQNSVNGTAAQQVNINPLVSHNGIAQTGNENGGDWQEEVYQKIKAMKDLYLLDLNDMHQKILGKLLQHDSLHQQPKSEQLEKLKVFKNMLERFMAFLQIQKHNILVSYKDKLTTYEKQIVHIITSNRRRPAPTQQQPPPFMQSQSQQTHGNPMTSQMQTVNLQQTSLSGGSTSNSQQTRMSSMLDSVSGSGSINPMVSDGAMGTLQLNTNMLHIKQQQQQLHKQLVQYQQQQQQFRQPEGNQVNQMTQLHDDGGDMKLRQQQMMPGGSLFSTQLIPGGVSPQIEGQTMFKTMHSANLTNVVNIGHGQAVLTSQSLAIGTPGISAEFTSPDGNGVVTSIGKSSAAEQPIERLLNVVKSISSNALSASVSDIGSVVSMIDRITGSAPGNRSTAAVGEDLVAMTKCHLQETSFITQDETNSNPNPIRKKMKCFTSAMPFNVAVKRPRIETNHSLLEEIKDINRGLIDTVVDISFSAEDVDPAAASKGTVVKCSFSAGALGPNLKSQYASAQMSPIQPLRLLVPANYPNCSPILLDKFPVEISKEYEDLSVKAKSRFSISLRSLSQPMSLKEIARTWDICARAVISEYAQQTGGGTFSSKYGTWENCLSVVN
ncbi:unnamed protein product [Lactuca virosa]|uniref:Mediator complex subunit 15 KIX domain-containing protein n=1 Tax=Lactuca virosa TaxID=75947 RepID=A0AAU9MNB6_9ASTR|nr:unnamed protein product [Lactuca virosa]